MRDYDAILKTLLTDLRGSAVEYLTGYRVTEWQRTELPKLGNLAADLVCAASDGSRGHLELQSRNDGRMALRMYDYGGRIFDQHGIYPWQLVLYVGEAPMSMPNRIAGPKLDYSFDVLDLRDLDGEPLLESSALSDNILAVLMRLRDQRHAVRMIVERIADADSARSESLEQLSVLAGLRKLGEVVNEESKRMPITESLMDHDLFGPVLRQGVAQGLVEGRVEGERKEALSMARRVVVGRFGRIPSAVDAILVTKTVAQLEDLVDRALRCGTLEDLFQQ